MRAVSFTVALPSDLRQQLVAAATRERLTMGEIVRRALDAEFVRLDRQRGRRKSDHLQAHAVAGDVA